MSKFIEKLLTCRTHKLIDTKKSKLMKYIVLELLIPILVFCGLFFYYFLNPRPINFFPYYFSSGDVLAIFIAVLFSSANFYLETGIEKYKSHSYLQKLGAVLLMIIYIIIKITYMNNTLTDVLAITYFCDYGYVISWLSLGIAFLVFMILWNRRLCFYEENV